MCWAEFFGIFYKKQVLLNNQVHMRIKDMRIDGYNVGKYNEAASSSSLDHGV